MMSTCGPDSEAIIMVEYRKSRRKGCEEEREKGRETKRGRKKWKMAKERCVGRAGMGDLGIY